MDSESANDDQGNPPPPDDRIELKIFSDPDAAEVARANLESHGIECWLTADDCAGMYPSLQLAEGVKLLVAKGQLAEAGQILASKNPITPDELERLATNAIPEPTAPRIKLSWPQLVTGIIVGVLLCLLYQRTTKFGTKTHHYDNNHDGKPDEISIERNGRIIEWRQDRNFDGAVDDWVYYDEDGIRSRAEADDNFDGRPDLFWTFTNNVTAASRADTDFNGTPDVTYTFQNDLVKQADWQPNGTKVIALRQFFRHGLLTEESRDTNMDGLFDVTIRYDAFQNPIGTNMFKLLSPTPR